jgi:hypothetical protein
MYDDQSYQNLYFKSAPKKTENPIEWVHADYKIENNAQEHMMFIVNNSFRIVSLWWKYWRYIFRLRQI